MTTADLTAVDTPLVLDAEDIARLPWHPVPGCAGVDTKQLWRFDSYVQAVIRYQPNASTVGAPHLAAHHHIWLVSGSATIAGRQLRAGSYLHVPPGQQHAVTAGAEGCVLLQMHRPHAPHEAERLR